jgi:pyroglutamyl-peptidase
MVSPAAPSSAQEPSAVASRPLTVLLTGFGPFPGAPYNPTGPLVQKLARLRRPALADVRLVGHVFDTSYAAIDRELPDLLVRYRPDAVLMFGLATRTKHLRVETRARNVAFALTPDVEGRRRWRKYAAGAPATLPFGPHCERLLAAARTAHAAAALSRDAGRYLCNYLCWRALEASAKPGGPLVAFVHVPQVRRGTIWRPALSLDDLVRAGAAILLAVVSETRR